MVSSQEHLNLCTSCPPECLLHRLSEEKLQAAGLRRAAYPASDVLFHYEDPCHERIFLLCTGGLGCCWGPSHYKKEKQCLEILGPGDWIGPECWQDGEWSCEVRALTDVAGWWVKEAEWVQCLCRWGLLERFMQQQEERLRELHQWQVVLARGSVRARLAWRLLQLARRFGQESPDGIFVSLHLTQEQQAKLVGATRPPVVQALKYFHDQGWLDCQREGFWIRQRQKLEEQSRE